MPRTAWDIVYHYCQGRLSGRPEYYSGRGATSGDLNGDHLGALYKGIKIEHGDEAAKAFVQMVFDTPVLSATAFLHNLYALEANGWKPIRLAKKPGSIDHFDLGDDREGREVMSMVSMGSWLGGGSERDDTISICFHFLNDHRAEITASKKEIEAKLDHDQFWGRKSWGMSHTR